MAKQRILVTGGAGFIGSHLVDRLIENGYAVRVLDNLSTGKLSNIKEHIDNGRIEFINGDIRNSDNVGVSVKDIDLIAHLAAQISVPYSIKNPKENFEINVTGTLNLLNALSKERKAGRFLFISSCAVYGDPEHYPVSEKTPTNPISPYAESKIEAEKLCLGFHQRELLKPVIFRLFNVYGPRQGLNEYSGVITKFFGFIKQKTPLTIYGDGLQTRDFVHVSNVVDAAMQALKVPEAVGEIFNIGTGKPVTVNELAESILKITNSNLSVQHLAARSGDIKQSYADNKKATSLLHYTPSLMLKDGLQTLLSSNKPQ